MGIYGRIMRAAVKNMYEELADNIDFPMLVYIYETGRVIALNRCGKEILNLKNYNINKIWTSETKLKITKDILYHGSKVFFNQKVSSDGKESVEIDIEINSIELDNIHICICFFEYSYKQYFVKHMRSQLPRIFWKDKKFRYLGINQIARDDVCRTAVPNSGMVNEDFLDVEMCTTELELDRRVILEKEQIYGEMQFFKAVYNPGTFGRVSRIPLINKNGTGVGMVGIYIPILSREEYRRLFDYTLREYNILSSILRKSDNVIISCSKENEYVFDYVSPNVSRFGYTVEQFYNREITMRTLVHTDDMKTLWRLLIELESGAVKEKLLRLRVYDGLRNLIVIRVYVEFNRRNSGGYSFECIIREISEEEMNTSDCMFVF